MLKKNKGITLVALIITIVILLILAVVTIGAVRDSSIIGHAQNAAKDYNQAKFDEESAILGYEELIDEYATGSGTGNGNGGESSVTYKDGVPVPTGFYYVTGTKDTGFVISDNPADENNVSGKSGNQFVWVPVADDISTTGYGSGTGYREPATVGEIRTDKYGNITGYTNDADEKNLRRANCEDIDKDGILELSDFEVELKSIYLEMATSVNKYDGFYVGRYETSINGTNPQSKASTEEVTITSATNASANTWYGLYALNKEYNTSSVKSSMIWGIQYDKMISWMGAAANTVIPGRNTNRTCGTAAQDVIKNVYDIYGNSYEWTLEAYDTGSRVCRGR